MAETKDATSKKSTCMEIWRITSSHVIAYFLAGIFALLVMNYKELYAADILSSIMKPVNEPIVALGPSLQIFRGLILSLAIIPLHEVFFHQKHGYLKLGLLILIFSLLSTIGPTTGSFDGYIFTKIPARYQLLGYPEAILYILIFVGILRISNKNEHSRIIFLLSILFVFLIIVMSIAGFLAAKGSITP